ncbi:MAG: hypothetical protein PHX78_06635 [bacterium]|nr:hypothetical protein [bacterium]
MKENLSNITPAINRVLEEAEEQVRRRQVEEKLEESTKELKTLQTNSDDTAKSVFHQYEP